MTNSQSSSASPITMTITTPLDTSLPPLTTTRIQHLINPKLDHNNFQIWNA